jgi:hypothetical protein
VFCTFHQILFRDQIKDNEMGEACGMYGEEEKCVRGFGGKPEAKRPCGRPRC